MSRLFVAASSQYLSAATPAVTAYPFTISVWVKPASATSGMAIGVYDTGGNADSWLIGGGGGAPPFLVARSTADGYHQLDHTTNLVAGTWVNLIGVFNNSTDRRLYINADAGVQQTTTCGVPSSLDATAIGRNHRLSAGGYFDGRIAQAAMWTSALGSSDRALLAAGNNPNTVASGSRVAWWPLTNNVSPETDDQGSLDLTVTGATYSTDDPPAAAVMSGTAAATGSATGTLGFGSAPTGPPSSTIACEMHARTSGTVTPNASDVFSTIKVFRSTASGGTYVEVTSNCLIAAGSGTTWTWQDNRPAYGSQPIPLSSTAYYKIKGVGGGVDSDYSSVVSVTADVDVPAVELAWWDAMHTVMSVQATRENTSHLGWAYPGRLLLNAAYIAAQYPAKTSEALTDLDTWWTFVKTQINADGLFIANGFSGGCYIAHNFELVIYTCAASRLLRGRLASNSTAVTLGNDMIARMNTLGKAVIDNLARQSLTASGAGAADETPSTATAWAATTSYSVGTIRKPTVANGRVYRQVAPSGQLSASSEPTWPTTANGVVNDGTCCWQECTADNPDWAATTAYTLGQVRRPTVKNGRSYRVTTAGTSGGSQPTWPTSNAGTVTDGSVTWTETTVVGTTAFFAVSYNPTSPYAAGSGASTIGDEMARVAAGYAALLTDTAATDFYTGGSYRTAANTLALDHVKLGDTLQVGTGALQQQGGWPAFDTSYGSYTAHLSSIALFLMGDSWSPRLVGWVDRTLDWLDNNFSVEEVIGHARPVALTKFPTPGPVARAELNWRRAAYLVRNRAEPLQRIVYSSAMPSNYTPAGYGYPIEGDDMNFLATLGVQLGYDLPTSLAGVSIATGTASGTLIVTPRISGTPSATGFLTGTFTIRVGISGSAAATSTLLGLFTATSSGTSYTMRDTYATFVYNTAASTAAFPSNTTTGDFNIRTELPA